MNSKLMFDRAKLLCFRTSFSRLYTNQSRSGLSRHLERRSRFRESVTEGNTKAFEKSISIGEGVLAGSAVVGMGALVYYGMGLSRSPGTLERQMLWPAFVKERVRDTFGYFGASLAVSAGTAVAAFRSPVILSFMNSHGLIFMGVTFLSTIACQMLIRSIPYEIGNGSNNVKKHLAWLLHSSMVGLMVAPMCLLGGPLLVRAAAYTGAMIGGLSTIALTAPSEKFLYMGGPLAMGFGVVFMSSLGSIFLPPTSALGSSLLSISVYGGLVVFGGLMLYNVQNIIHKAENTPPEGNRYNGVQNAHYDPINSSVGIFITTINIFTNIARVLALNGRRK